MNPDRLKNIRDRLFMHPGYWISVVACMAILLSAVTHHPAAQEANIPKSIETFLGAADLAAGEKVFLQCRTCHTADKTGKHAIGPNLWNVVGRKIGSVPGYDYSSAMANQGDVWHFENLDSYLWNPQQFIPNTRMTFPGIERTQDRINIIAYLRKLGASPLPFESPANEPMPNDSLEPTNQEDAWGGLASGRGREEVFYTCQACHSFSIIKQQCLDRDSWDEILQWMVEEQGMKAPTPENWKRILSYLAIHFGLEC
uniref:Sulfite dehydrogenase (Cytochrome) subunit SorB n=1 Tax=Candidatus Kentrum sp. TUN TaxID=2126343 RepID=A0A451AV13_9GAMM|nr:MAG: sulfite dehydrogenase (cytochrome) subunit SorB [Candidatus Kentron sp. TUN]VFK69737.1 MAG: sulfite dehydrogenase (cytochrome) subunit SorB [Candidatus Kentron sp. TUN]